MSGIDDDIDLKPLQIRQILADIDQKRADMLGKQQEVKLAPWAFALGGIGTGAALFAAAAAFAKLLL